MKKPIFSVIEQISARTDSAILPAAEKSFPQ
jgi:hypothetical protein